MDWQESGCPAYTTGSPRNPDLIAEPLQAIVDTVGNCLDTTPTPDWSFTVEETAPALIATIPADLSGTPDVTPEGTLTYQFDEALDTRLPLPAITQTTFTAWAVAACSDGSDYAIGGCIRFGQGGVETSACVADLSCDTAIFEPVAPFGLPTLSSVELDLLDNETADLAQNVPMTDAGDRDPMAGIEVEDTLGPQVICTVPADDSECASPIAAPAQIDVTFDDNVVGVTEADVRLEDVTNGVAVNLTGKVSINNRVVSLTSLSLAADTCYRVSVLTTVVDDDATALRRPHHFGFATLP